MGDVFQASTSMSSCWYLLEKLEAALTGEADFLEYSPLPSLAPVLPCVCLGTYKLLMHVIARHPLHYPNLCIQGG